MGTSHPVPDKWELFQDQLTDSAPEVPPTFRIARKHDRTKARSGVATPDQI